MFNHNISKTRDKIFHESADVAFLADSWFKISIIINRINCSAQEKQMSHFVFLS